MESVFSASGFRLVLDSGIHEHRAEEHPVVPGRNSDGSCRTEAVDVNHWAEVARVQGVCSAAQVDKHGFNACVSCEVGLFVRRTLRDVTEAGLGEIQEEDGQQFVERASDERKRQHVTALGAEGETLRSFGDVDEDCYDFQR
jgi:hypothetical protein